MINNCEDLDKAIEELERRKVIRQAMLTEQFHATADHFKPGNLIKSAFNNIIAPSSTRDNILKTVGGLGVGFLTKNLLLGKSTSLIGKLASNALKVGAANGIMQNTDKITAWSTAIYNNLFKKSKTKEITF